MASEGSSPLARGLRAGLVGQVRPVGIIPARAGFTGWARGHLTLAWDHPRSRGVYVQGRHSPPGGLGIIPARAGFTSRVRSGRGGAPDHPRSRGVYPTPRATSCSACGSSPLARGLRGVDLDDARDRGIIPARAGFTTGWRSRHRRAGDHPRSRGVYSSRTRGLVGVPGSSPLARGLRVDGDIPGHRRWIIPARAGFT